LACGVTGVMAGAEAKLTGGVSLLVVAVAVVVITF